MSTTNFWERYNADLNTDRFWDKVNVSAIPGVCWVWTGGGTNGYGQFRVGSKTCYAHRVAYEFLVGPILEGLELDHLCKVKLCVNPIHLEPVTASENCRRREAHKTHCPKGHPYSGDNLYMWHGGRYCLACIRGSRQRSLDKVKARKVMSLS